MNTGAQENGYGKRGENLKQVYALPLCVPNGSLLNDETSAEWRALSSASQNRNLSIYSED